MENEKKNHINQKIPLPGQKEPKYIAITLKPNGLDSSIKRQRLLGNIKTAKTHSRCTLFVRDILKTKHKGK